MPHRDEVRNVLLGESKAVNILRDQIVKAASTRAPVLIYGPAGSGKEVTAQEIHAASGRSGPFTPMSAGNLSEFISRNIAWCDNWEVNSSLGAYSAVAGDRQSDDRTVFLKEICQLQPSSQAMLLHAFKVRLFQCGSSGSGRNSGRNFRLVSATDVNPKHLLEGGRFHESLLRKLGSVTISVPSLIERYRDIPALAMHFLSTLPETCRPLGCTAAAMRSLQEYHWPGNLWELQRVITAAATLAPNAMLDEMAITFALDTVDRERHVTPVTADSRTCGTSDEGPDYSALQPHAQVRGTLVPNHLAKRTISYGHWHPELTGLGTGTSEDKGHTRSY